MFLVRAHESGRIDNLPLPKGAAMGRSAKQEGGRHHDKRRKQLASAAARA